MKRASRLYGERDRVCEISDGLVGLNMCEWRWYRPAMAMVARSPSFVRP